MSSYSSKDREGVPAGSSYVQPTSCLAGEGWQRKACHSVPGEHRREDSFLSWSGTQASLETQTQEEALKVTQYPNSTVENDIGSSDASLLERTDFREGGEGTPVALRFMPPGIECFLLTWTEATLISAAGLWSA